MSRTRLVVVLLLVCACLWATEAARYDGVVRHADHVDPNLWIWARAAGLRSVAGVAIVALGAAIGRFGLAASAPFGIALIASSVRCMIGLREATRLRDLAPLQGAVAASELLLACGALLSTIACATIASRLALTPEPESESDFSSRSGP